MNHMQITKEQAIAMLAVWEACGHNLPSLMKLSPNQINNEIYLLIPGYRCNKWYQLEGPHSSYSEAFATYGELLDTLSSVERSPAKTTTVAA